MGFRYAAILENIPHCNHGGGGITAFTAVKAMRECGNEVIIVALSPDPNPGSDRKHIDELEDLGIKVRLLKGTSEYRQSRKPSRFFPSLESLFSRLTNRFSRFFPSPEALFPGLTQRNEVEVILDEIRPDAVFMYHWNALAAVYGLKKYPKFGSVGDPAHLPYLSRNSFLHSYGIGGSWNIKINQILEQYSKVPRMVRLQLAMLGDCDVCGAFAAHHAELFRSRGNLNCLYLHTPTPDPGSKRQANARGRFRILHIGHLQGIATLTGVKLLANEILPELERIMPPDSFEIHLVGGSFDTMPTELQRSLSSKHVKILGKVNPPDAEFIASDVVLVPTPIELGIRVRIITAFSFGNCVVAHTSNQKGIPEMEHGVNALLAKEGRELAWLCKDVFDSQKLGREIGDNARATYEAAFSPKSAGGRICEIMENLISTRARQAPF